MNGEGRSSGDVGSIATRNWLRSLVGDGGSGSNRDGIGNICSLVRMFQGVLAHSVDWWGGNGRENANVDHATGGIDDGGGVKLDFIGSIASKGRDDDNARASRRRGEAGGLEMTTSATRGFHQNDDVAGSVPIVGAAGGAENPTPLASERQPTGQAQGQFIESVTLRQRHFANEESGEAGRGYEGETIDEDTSPLIRSSADQLDADRHCDRDSDEDDDDDDEEDRCDYVIWQQARPRGSPAMPAARAQKAAPVNALPARWFGGLSGRARRRQLIRAMLGFFGGIIACAMVVPWILSLR